MQINFKFTVLGLALVMAEFICATHTLAAQPAVAPKSDALYQQLGGQSGLVKLMDDLMVRLLADKRMGPFFKDSNKSHVKAQLVLQICELSGGPCKREGPDMKVAHANMDITPSHFNALVEVLQHSMDAQGIAFGTQNRLLALLAPMHREIVNTP
jgi:hemoglobin